MRFVATASIRGRVAVCFLIAVFVGGYSSRASAGTTGSSSPPSSFEGYRPGDVLWIGHDGSSVSAFTHTPLSAGGVYYDLRPLLSSPADTFYDWNNVRAIDVNRRGQIVLGDIDGPAIFMADLAGGPMRILSGQTWEVGQSEVGSGPHLEDVSDIEFGPDGFVYLLSQNSNHNSPSWVDVMRIDPVDGARSIVTTFDFPTGQGPDRSRFAFAPDGKLFVSISSRSRRETSLYGVDIATGAMRPVGDGTAPYEFGAGDLAIGLAGEAYLLVDTYDVRRLDLETGETEPVLDTSSVIFDSYLSELEVAPDGSLVLMSSGDVWAAENITSPRDFDLRRLATSLPLNRPYTMALVPVPEPAGILLVVVGGLMLGLARPRLGRV